MKKFLCLIAGLITLGTSLVAQAQETVYFYNWSEYIPEEILSDFTKETGIKVVYTTYDSNESMYAKLKLLDKKNSYDLVVPSTYFLSKMASEKLLLPLDKSLLGNFKHLNTELLNRPFDPINQYSVPYLWGSTGLAVNNEELDGKTITSWQDLWRPEFKGQVLLHNDVREVFHMALSILGYSGNTQDPKQIEQAYQKLTELMPNVRAFNSDAPRIPYIEGEVNLGMIWNGESYIARNEGFPLQYIYPSEGVILWMDNLAIPANARNPKGAHQLIEFLLRPQVSKQIAEYVGYATPNTATMKLLAPEVANDPSIYPSPEILKAGEFQVDVGDAVSIYQKYWEQLKTGN
ncbi:extracellular solute-binding protein [Pelagibaculum spongiae]|uniref:Putrescine-binding periplasmic protein n=1 Tax=Pelagibaculum spongiae TaxID=2080658 RepID=A0A2V1GPX7_9GAMM|nr:extracellular solute-binding protein [Pelagibaculum spongiae]PVZ62945.1 spermidine/putrescine ABC transporter substrate-binding protein PotD [Pelagibaculum spongiae]